MPSSYHTNVRIYTAVVNKQGQVNSKGAHLDKIILRMVTADGMFG